MLSVNLLNGYHYYQPSNRFVRGGSKLCHYGELVRDLDHARIPVVALTHITPEGSEHNRRIIRKIETECSNLTRIAELLPNHPNIIHFFGAFNTCFFFERGRCDLCDLVENNYVEPFSRQTFNGSKLSLIVDGMLHAFASLHDAGWVHLDAKLENFVIGMDGNIKLIDWQCACPISEPGNFFDAGTPEYRPPEVWSAQEEGTTHIDLFAWDRWSVGWTIVFLYKRIPEWYRLMGDPDFPRTDPVTVAQMIHHYFENRVWDPLEDLPVQIGRRMAALNPTERLTAREALTALNLQFIREGRRT